MFQKAFKSLKTKSENEASNDVDLKNLNMDEYLA